MYFISGWVYWLDQYYSLGILFYSKTRKMTGGAIFGGEGVLGKKSYFCRYEATASGGIFL